MPKPKSAAEYYKELTKWVNHSEEWEWENGRAQVKSGVNPYLSFFIKDSGVLEYLTSIKSYIDLNPKKISDKDTIQHLEKFCKFLEKYDEIKNFYNTYCKDKLDDVRTTLRETRTAFEELEEDLKTAQGTFEKLWGKYRNFRATHSDAYDPNKYEQLQKAEKEVAAKKTELEELKAKEADIHKSLDALKGNNGSFNRGVLDPAYQLITELKQEVHDHAFERRSFLGASHNKKGELVRTPLTLLDRLKPQEERTHAATSPDTEEKSGSKHRPS